MKYPKMEGVGTHLNINPKDNDFMIKVRELVDLQNPGKDKQR